MSQVQDLTTTSLHRPGKKLARTHAALLKALLELLEEKSFEQITIREITAKAGVGYATFFRRYQDKEELLHDLAAQEIRSLLTMTLPIVHVADTYASTLALCSFIWKHQKLWRALLTGGAAAILKEAYLREALEACRDQADPSASLPIDLAVSVAIAGIVEMLSWWLRQTNPPDVEAMAKTINRLAIRPVFEQGDQL